VSALIPHVDGILSAYFRRFSITLAAAMDAEREQQMRSNELLSQIRSREAANLRACFPGISERDLLLLLGSKPQQAVGILQRCFGCDVEDAKAAWNDYVLRHVDGPRPGRLPDDYLMSR
jgi:hypothetical protein